MNWKLMYEVVKDTNPRTGAKCFKALVGSFEPTTQTTGWAFHVEREIGPFETKEEAQDAAEQEINVLSEEG